VLKVLAAICLVVLALGFGALGACGVVVSLPELWGTITRRSPGSSLGSPIGLIFAVVGFTAAGGLIWAVVLMFQKRRDPDE